MGKATKIVTKRSKKLRFKSQAQSDKRWQEIYKNNDAGYWAEYEPRRDVGVFANWHGTYKHNGEVRFM